MVLGAFVFLVLFINHGVFSFFASLSRQLNSVLLPELAGLVALRTLHVI